MAGDSAATNSSSHFLSNSCRRAVSKFSVFLLVRSLEVGGAERQLVQLAMGLHKRGHKVRVAVFYLRGPLASELVRCGIEIIDLGKKNRWEVLRFLARTVIALRRAKPDVIYSMLGGANIVAAVVRWFVPKTKLVWTVRASNTDLRQYNWLHEVSYRVECGMSRIPDLIIANSTAGRDFAVANGFPPSSIHVVPNGIDTERFQPNCELRSEQRRVWNLDDEEIAIGVLARLDPMKDHETFLRAAMISSEREPGLRFLCIGEGSERRRLETLVERLGIAANVNFVGSANPVAALNALDIVCSSSAFGEGFSNSVAEAMSCGRPCIVTDVGDSAMIVGNCGEIVPPSNPKALAAAILDMAQRLKSIDGSKIRWRIVENFSADAMIDRTLRLIRKVALEV